ncbi:MAG: hypothetical protein NVSMB9_27620 [Isosphaeraceae bacterium]
MSTESRSISCGAPGCNGPAQYKIAATWSAGRFSELKTYGLACETHYAQLFHDAVNRRKAHPPSREESQGEIGVYRYVKGKPDKSLEKVPNPG